MRCPECGFENVNGAEYCDQCGVPFDEGGKGKKQPPRKVRKVSRDGSHAGWLVAGAVFLLFVGYLIFDNIKDSSRNPQVFSPSSAILHPQTLAIADKFLCGCGCKDGDTLATCGCEFAQGAQRFISNLLDQRIPEERIIKLVNERYGGLRPDISSLSPP